MKIAGIIAEYNPFHNGHAYHIAATRAALGEDCAIVCVMSGNFVQRGAAAVFDKWSRAASALNHGADLIFELPLPYAISSAEHFARGSVQVLNASGIVDVLSFGSEWDATDDIWNTAQYLNSKEFQESLPIWLNQGLSFASARQKAADAHLGPAALCLAQPNSTLGVEYCKALLTTNSSISPLSIPRLGAPHDSAALSGGFASASQIRRMLTQGEPVGQLLPVGSSYGAIHSLQHCERAVLARLRTMSPSEFEGLPDCGEGLSNRLYAAVQESRSVEEILSRCKTKRYAHSRLRRLVLWAFLGMTAADRPTAPPYLRILGFNEVGRTILSQMRSKSKLPVLTKPAHVRKLSDAANRVFELESRSTDLYGLCSDRISVCGMEWKSKPICKEYENS
jgi:predicted nucleotidyltransferase